VNVEKQVSIHGITCRLNDRGMRQAARQVLDQIKRRRPEDYARVVARVREIVSLTAEETEDGTQGKWRRDPSPKTWGLAQQAALGDWDEVGSGMVYLADPPAGADRAAILGLVAHEFGHVATKFFDLRRRQALTDEWASELCADWYAYRWGYGRQIAADRKNRNWGHHCAGPGQGFSMDLPGADGIERRCYYRVTRNFCVRHVRSVRLKTRKPEGK
jgi:hypothetical protein